MPKPQRLAKSLVVHADNDIVTLNPPQVSDSVVVDPKMIWNGVEKFRSARYEFFLAAFTASIPATLQPSGSLVPLSDHVLAWVLLGQHEPFDPGTAGMAVTPRASATRPTKPPAPSCSFVGESVFAWNALTGVQIHDEGYVLTHPEKVRPILRNW
jgi:hypothetical protein